MAKTPKKLQLLIVGSAYSGSSLLSVLLDRVQGIFSMGEGARRYRPGVMCGPCAKCGVPDAADCELYKDWQPSRMVDLLQDDVVARHHDQIHQARSWGREPDKETGELRIGESFHEFVCRNTDELVIVDSTKDPTQMLEQLQTGPNFPVKAVFLSKAPLEAFNSYYRHPRAMTAPECVQEWLNVNWFYSGFLRINHIDTLYLKYRDLCFETEVNLRRICDFVGLPYQLRSDWDVPKGHILGGNPAVSSVVSKNDDLCFVNGSRATHMGGKYAEVDAAKPLQVTYDTTHYGLESGFRMECQQAMNSASRFYAPLLQLFGYGAEEMQLFR